MCEPTTIAVMSAAAGAINVAGQIQQGKVAAQVGRNNQIAAEYAATDALRRGEEQAQKARRDAEATKSAQRVTLAASGLDLNSGTALDLQDQTDFFGQLDQNTARTNARNEASNARYSGAMSRAQGDASRAQANIGAFGTVLGTGAQVSSKWYDQTKKV
jgi:hypothetical protein